MICEPINTNDAVSVKRCTKCGEIKALTEFSFNNKSKGTRHADCKKCGVEYRRSRLELKRNYDVVYDYERRKNNPAKIALKNSLYLALKRRPTDNPTTLNELMDMLERQKGRCALSGIDMVCGGGGGRAVWNSVSLDRINPEEGYVTNNVRLICFCINAFRGRMTDNEFDEVIAKLYHHRNLANNID